MNHKRNNTVLFISLLIVDDHRCQLGDVSPVIMLWTVLQWRHSVWIILIQGALLTGWIIIRMFMLKQFNYVHSIYGGIGFKLLAIGYQL